jgi:ferrous iron transport protein A
MKSGESGIVVEFLGGYGFINRLNALGIRLCKQITKVNTMLMRGPIIIDVDGMKIAVGYGMAHRIIVEVTDEDTTYGQS